MSNLVDDLTEDITVPEHLQDVISIMDALDTFHAARESTYSMSFAQRGEIGVWMNLARKYDRIDNLARKTFEAGGSHGVTLVDTLVDTAMYALKWLAIIKHVRPEDLESWIERVYCHDTGLDVTTALASFGLGDMPVAESMPLPEVMRIIKDVTRMGEAQYPDIL